MIVEPDKAQKIFFVQDADKNSYDQKDPRIRAHGSQDRSGLLDRVGEAVVLVFDG